MKMTLESLRKTHKKGAELIIQKPGDFFIQGTLTCFQEPSPQLKREGVIAIAHFSKVEHTNLKSRDKAVYIKNDGTNVVPL